MLNHLRRFTLCARRPILNRHWRAARLHRLQCNAFPVSICLTQDFPRSNTVPAPCTHRPVRHRASTKDRTDFQIKSPDPPPETMLQLCMVIQEVWDYIPQMQIRAWGTWFVTTIIDLALLSGLLHRAKCHNKLLLSNGFATSHLFNPYETISLGSFYNYRISRWN